MECNVEAFPRSVNYWIRGDGNQKKNKNNHHRHYSLTYTLTFLSNSTQASWLFRAINSAFLKCVTRFLLRGWHWRSTHSKNLILVYCPDELQIVNNAATTASLLLVVLQQASTGVSPRTRLAKLKGAFTSTKVTLGRLPGQQQGDRSTTLKIWKRPIMGWIINTIIDSNISRDDSNRKMKWKSEMTLRTRKKFTSKAMVPWYYR